MGGPQTLSEKVSEVKETRQTSIRTPTSCSDISKKKMLNGREKKILQRVLSLKIQQQRENDSKGNNSVSSQLTLIVPL